jgi:hypothetical protein
MVVVIASGKPSQEGLKGIVYKSTLDNTSFGDEGCS